jgi:hypothetical protein
VKECGVGDMKVNAVVNMSAKTGFIIMFTNDGSSGIHIWFKRLILEYVMFY